MSRSLDVYLRESLAGSLIQMDDGQLCFFYDPDYLSSNGAALSVSMPRQEAPYPDAVTRPFFSGLLPDERARKRLASALGVSQQNAFGLLEIIGGECAGALSLLPKGSAPPDFRCQDIEPLDEKRLSQILDLLRDRPLLGGEEGVRLSLAGAQDKLAVCVSDGQISLPKAGKPTTHILKPFIEGLDGTVENELFCMRLANRVGLQAPHVIKSSAGNTDFILVERYDRVQEADGSIAKLHQEDFCQALSVPPELKYEEEGGPGITQSAGLIQKHTRRPAAERLAFQRMVMFHYMVGNADAHAKNFSLLYHAGTPDLAPLYDAVCTAAYPRLTKKLAMQIGGRGLADTITLEQWYALTSQTKAAQRVLRTELATMASRIEEEADALLVELQAEDLFHPVLKTVGKIIGTRVKLVRDQLEKA